MQIFVMLLSVASPFIRPPACPPQNEAPERRSCALPFSSHDNTFTSCTNGGQMTAEQREASSPVLAPLLDDELPDDGHLFGRCSLHTDEDDSWIPVGYRPLWRCICEETDIFHDGGALIASDR
eukprot:SAG11_NODE_225_length_12064_cov_7.850815_6_plen_123_part_00